MEMKGGTQLIWEGKGTQGTSQSVRTTLAWGGAGGDTGPVEALLGKARVSTPMPASQKSLQGPAFEAPAVAAAWRWGPRPSYQLGISQCVQGSPPK